MDGAREDAHATPREDARALLERAFRADYGRILAALAVRFRDIGRAEEALGEALAAAAERWAVKGAPADPAAWLYRVAERRALDATRRHRRRAATRDALADHTRLLAGERTDPAAGRITAVPDDRLKLMFACCHPAIDARVRAPLTLQTVAGLDARRIARAFLVSERAMAQRLVRAKRKIRQARIPFREPEPADLAARLEGVLAVIYLIYNEGHSDAATADPERAALCREALWLGRVLVHLMPGEPEPLGLLSLMLYAQSRTRTRVGADGVLIPLADQDTTRWDRGQMVAAGQLLGQAAALARPGPYQTQAAIQSAHAARAATGRTDWPAIAGLYDALMTMTPTPVVALNRAVALSYARDAAAGLEALDAIADTKALAAYQPYWAARADMLARVGRATDARAAYDRALVLTLDEPERAFLKQRLAALG